MADVRRALDHTPAESRRDGAEAFGREDRSRVVLVARGGRALGVVDAAHDRRERERQRDRKVDPRERQASEKGEARPGDGEMEGRRFVKDRREQRALKSGGLERPRDGHGGDDRDERSRQAAGQAHAAEQRHEDHAEPDESDDRVGEDLEQREQADERDPRAADRAEQGRPGEGGTDGVAGQGEPGLEEADQDGHGHSHLPREDRVARRQVRGPENGEGHAEDTRRVQPERHRRDVVAPGPSREPAGQVRVDEVPDENADGRARHHPLEHDVPREVEGADQDRREDDEVRHVVEHEREERVQIAGPEGVSAHQGRSTVVRGVGNGNNYINSYIVSACGPRRRSRRHRARRTRATARRPGNRGRPSGGALRPRCRNGRARGCARRRPRLPGRRACTPARGSSGTGGTGRPRASGSGRRRAGSETHPPFRGAGAPGRRRRGRSAPLRTRSGTRRSRSRAGARWESPRAARGPGRSSRR